MKSRIAFIIYVVHFSKAMYGWRERLLSYMIHIAVAMYEGRGAVIRCGSRFPWGTRLNVLSYSLICGVVTMFPAHKGIQNSIAKTGVYSDITLQDPKRDKEQE